MKIDSYLRYIVYAAVFLVPFIPLIVTNSLFFPFITGKNFIFRILVEIMFASWAVLAILQPRYRPRFSWIVGGLGVLVITLFFSAVFGENPLKSFWSNFERMEGYVTILHLFLYVLVVSHVLNTKKLWDYFFNTTLFAASLIALYSFAQLGGAFEINQGGLRIDATLGNSAYLAVYMLFHIFIAAFMFARSESKSMWPRVIYGGLAVVFAYLLVQTATRGTVLGFVGGTLLMSLYIIIFGKTSAVLRKVSLGVVVLVVVLVGLFIAFKDQPFIQENEILRRYSTISIEALDTRFIIWSMALEGIKERPILGWGQGNFNYVFNEKYDPGLYADEPWFDRVHNIVLDWLVAGGIVGFLAYFSVYFAALYFAVLRPILKRDKADDDEEERFSVAEQGILLGLFAGYMLHNLVVFDNIVSYIFYGSFLAMIHSRVGRPVQFIQDFSLDRKIVANVVAPVVAVVLVLVIYYANVPNLLVSSDIIKSFRAQTIDDRFGALDLALSRNSFADQEIKEQMTRLTQQTIADPNLPSEMRTELIDKAEQELLRQVDINPNDARVRVFISSFYRSTGDTAKALEQLEAARELSPGKPHILFEVGLTHLQRNDLEAMKEAFREAFELEPRYRQARLFYAGAAIYTRDDELLNELLETAFHPDFLRIYRTNDFVLSAAFNTSQYDKIIDMLSYRVEANPNDLQLRVSFAVSHHESGDTDTAISILEEAIVDFPQFEEQGRGYIEELRSGGVPQ